jgi:class 3 adenylate cyclase/tetratricopeptide (TPR) repeat protein
MMSRQLMLAGFPSSRRRGIICLVHRKVVTVVFCDVVGSTALGESIDPEALQGLLARYFERMKATVEINGGSVEKFIGDAVLAVFGVPAAHEDDALRAMRAASEMLAAFPELGLSGRIGINTGEVVTGMGERLVTGDAVNVAARLQQAAAPDEVLIGRATLDLVREAVEVDAVEPLELKGKSDLVSAYRLLSVQDAPERRHGSRFVGRGRELALIEAAWQRASADRRCELVTIVGHAGVGKSRLVAEAVSGNDARVVRARCLPYGEGITYWPVTEILKQLDAQPSDPAAEAVLRSLVGESEHTTSAEEIAWAFRKLLEQEAPLILLFDDVHWGEETFLDLVESVSLLSSDAPLLLVCIARPELLDRRPHWPGTLRLEPLGESEVDDLIGEQVPAELRERIARASGGNPLFLTEMLAMAGESEDVEVPATLRALLAARLDQLDSAERSVLERGAVEGEVFHLGAVQALEPGEQHVTPRLAALVRKELIRPDRAQLPGEDGFRFRHLLIRDAAYDSLAKATRAELHERFAAWLDRRAADIVELDEIVGYHLEQAVKYKQELGQPDAALAVRAGERLGAAGRRARWRSDALAAAGLLERALHLMRPHRLDIYLELDLAEVLARRDPRRAAALAEAAGGRARDSGDAVGEAVARAVNATHAVRTGDTSVEELEALARAALPLLEDAGDDRGLVHVWGAVFRVSSIRGHYEETREAAERALQHARLAGWPLLASQATGLAAALVHGPRPADEVLRELEPLVTDVAAHPRIRLYGALMLGMLGDFKAAWPAAHEASAQLRERFGDDASFVLAYMARFEGDREASARYFRGYCDFLEEHGLRSTLSTYAPQLARELCALGQHSDAEPLAQLGRELGDVEDVTTQIAWRLAQALVEADRGQHAEAERLAREAVQIGERTDMLIYQGDTLCVLAEVLQAAGRTEDAVAAFAQALERYERKKNVAMSTQMRERLAGLESVAR